MASASGIRAGQAFVELFADDSRLIRGLKAASKKLKAWGREVAAIGRTILASGMAAIGGLVGATKVFASMGDNVQKMSLRTGVSAEALSELGFAAEQSGTDLATLELGLRHMQRTIAEAAEGSGEAQEALAALGLSAAHLAGLTPEEQFKLIADRLARIPDPTLRAALAMQIFGRSGTKLLPLLQNGAAGIEELQKQARELGLTISTEDANAAAALTDAMNILWRVIKQTAFTIGAALAPTLKNFVEQATRVIKGVIDWVKQNKSVVVIAFKVAAAVAFAGAAFIALGGVITALGYIVGGLASVLMTIGAIFSTIGSAFVAILSPIGLVVTALAALGGYFLYVSGAGQKALAWLGQQFAKLRDDFLAAWQGISDALAAGDIGLAAKILWLTLRMEWQRGIAWLTEKWVEFKITFMGIGTEAAYGLAKNLTIAWAGIQAVWADVVAYMSQGWVNFVDLVVNKWRSVQNWLAKKIVALMSVFDKTIDVEAVTRILDEDFQREQDQRQKAKEQRLREIEESRQAKQKAIDEEKQGALKAIDEERERRRAERKKQYEGEIKEAEEAAKKAEDEWKAALDEAAKKREEQKAKAPPEGEKLPEDKLKDLDVNGLMRRAISVTGTFNPLAAGGLATGAPLERVARASEETAKNTRKLLQQSQRGAVFT